MIDTVNTPQNVNASGTITFDLNLNQWIVVLSIKSYFS